MADWTRIEPVAVDALPADVRVPGTLVHTNEGAIRLIGHVNQDIGLCACCPDHLTIDAYRVLDIDWTDGPEPLPTEAPTS